ncbi:SDR family NAD(P)-dependent oxidoreductase [Nocardia anaemiae]|uniref:SDR family NAD(P)-dependent oxidoreductase n=1 Tax=Nocardia anaemiae TaxID=263910 RepID=UPI0007A49E10|nr:SDR family oxidoreductase [Nocardia anaemiae]
MPRTDLTGKIVLVVGASSGIGRRFAELAAEAGAVVAITARRTELLDQIVAAQQALGHRCSAHPADATDAAAARDVVEQVIRLYGRIDLVLLNAGGAPALDLSTLTADAITGYMRTNYDVAVNYLVPVLTHMRERGTGTVAHTNSLAGWYAIPLAGPYSAAKAALRVLIDAYRIEYAASGIRFVAIFPGFVRTEATVGDGMPAPGEIDEDTAARHMLRAVTRATESYSFPWPLATLVGFGRLLPARARRAVLGQMLRIQQRSDEAEKQ